MEETVVKVFPLEDAKKRILSKREEWKSYIPKMSNTVYEAIEKNLGVINNSDVILVEFKFDMDYHNQRKAADFVLEAYAKEGYLVSVPPEPKTMQPKNSLTVLIGISPKDEPVRLTSLIPSPDFINKTNNEE